MTANTSTQNQITTIIFDLGNTLVHFEGNWMQTLKEASQVLSSQLINCGLDMDSDAIQEVTFDALQSDEKNRDITLVETPVQTLIEQAIEKEFQFKINPQCLRNCLDKMYAVTQAHWLLEHDTHQCLQNLKEKGYQLGIISNARDDKDVQTQVNNGNIRPYFDQIMTSSEMGIRKPNPAIFHKALSFWNAQPENALMVGDNLKADVYGSQQIGMKGVWLTRRADTTQNNYLKDFVKPWLTVSNLTELADNLPIC